MAKRSTRRVGGVTLSANRWAGKRGWKVSIDELDIRVGAWSPKVARKVAENLIDMAAFAESMTAAKPAKAKRGPACLCAERNSAHRARGWTEGYSCDKCRGVKPKRGSKQTAGEARDISGAARVAGAIAAASGQAKQSEGDRQTEGYIGVIRRSGQAKRGGA